jgi:protein O-GlcNAc transferase
MANVAAIYREGIKQQQAGDLHGAEKQLRRVVRLDPGHAEAHFSLALTLSRLGNVTEAAAAYARAAQLKPTLAEAHLNLGNLHKSQGRTADAEECFRRSVAVRPKYGLAHYNLGNSLLARGAFDEAIESYRRAVEYDPQYVDAWCNLGLACLAAARHEEAAEAYRRAIEINPQSASAVFGLGNALCSLQRLAEAETQMRRALELNPQLAEAHNNLGTIRQAFGDLTEAEACYQRALDVSPRFANALNNLATLQNMRGRIEESAENFRRVLEIDPRHPEGSLNLATVYRAVGRLDEAIAALDVHLSVRPGNARARVMKGTMVPPLYSSREEVQAARRTFEENLAQLTRDGVRLDPEIDEMPTLFYLPYHGENDRDLQTQLAQLYPVPQTFDVPESAARRASADGRIRIGFISHHFSNHTIGYLTRGLIAALDRKRFHVNVLSHGLYSDEIGVEIRNHADEFSLLPERLSAARKQILDRRFDVLFYPDVGMEGFTYSLAFHRLAPVQCVTWGHPVTTGIPNIDYFISSDLVEPDDATGHYTETLICLNGLPTYYYRPVRERAPMTRADFGIPADCHAYLCPQSLFKFHPDFDPVLAEILRRDPQGRVFVIEGLVPAWTTFLKSRFERAFPDTADRVQFLPKQKHAEFLELLAICDVMLDPLHFGGGNTTYEGLGQGIPIVTMPSPYMRGRVTAGCYRKMGLTDCIVATPEEYIAAAVRLGTDAAYREALRARILETNHTLYEDAASLRELEQFLVNAVEATRPPPEPTITGHLSGRWRG